MTNGKWYLPDLASWVQAGSCILSHMENYPEHWELLALPQINSTNVLSGSAQLPSLKKRAKHALVNCNATQAFKCRSLIGSTLQKYIKAASIIAANGDYVHC